MSKHCPMAQPLQVDSDIFQPVFALGTPDRYSNQADCLRAQLKEYVRLNMPIPSVVKISRTTLCAIDVSAMVTYDLIEELKTELSQEREAQLEWMRRMNDDSEQHF